MIYVKLVRKEGLKSTHELLWLDPYAASRTHDSIIVSQSDRDSCGYTLTEDDFERLYQEKKARQDKLAEERRRKDESELAELMAWKAEMKSKNFIQQVITLWNMRKRQ